MRNTPYKSATARQISGKQEAKKIEKTLQILRKGTDEIANTQGRSKQRKQGGEQRPRNEVGAKMVTRTPSRVSL